MNTNNPSAQFTSLLLTTLGFTGGCVASAYSESQSVTGTVALIEGEWTGIFRVRCNQGAQPETDVRTWKHWDRARVAQWVAGAMAEYGVSL